MNDVTVTATRRSARRAAHPLRERLRAGAAARSIPLKLHLELTKRCNLACRHCYLSDPGDELSTERVLRLLDEVAELGCMGVVVTGGEVGLRPDFLEVASHVKRRRMVLSVLTNGTLFTDADLVRLAELRPATVAVSLYSVDSRLHDEITGLPGSQEETLRTVRRLRSLGVRCAIHTPLMPDTIAGFGDIIKVAEDLGCRYIFDPTIVPREDGRDDVVSYRVSPEQLRCFFRDSRLLGKTREGSAITEDDAEAADAPLPRLGPCAAGITAAFVGADGEVLPCMGFLPAFGNIAVRAFKQVWHGECAVKHREMMRRPAAECQACDLLRYCTTRCPRLAVGEGRPARGANQRACELAAMVRDLRAEYAERL